MGERGAGTELWKRWNRVMGGLEAWGRGGQGLSYGRERWPGLNNGKKRYSVRLEKQISKTSQKILHFLAPLGNARFFEMFLRFVSQVLSTLSLFPIV